MEKLPRRVVTLGLAILVVGAVLWASVLILIIRGQVRLANELEGAEIVAKSEPNKKSQPTKDATPRKEATPVDPSRSLERGRALHSGNPSPEAILQGQQALREIPENAPEFREAQRLLAASEAKQKKADVENLREKLKAQYEVVLSAANPHLNYITVEFEKGRGGYKLWGKHEYFTQYYFSIGSGSKAVSDWIALNQGNFKQAQIVEVGVKSKRGRGGWSSFKVR